nr:ABC transporter substrate-binding protein [Cellulosimicrobium sp. MM]
MVANFNPYAPNPLHVTNGGIYEPLFFYNRAEAGDPTPRLGESYEWSEDGTELTVKIREGVKWSDGEDFTVEDVIFSYTNEAAKRDYLNTIEKVDESTVKFTFNGAQFTSAVQILGTTLMVPEHLFKEVSDLITYTNEEPVGTGPFTLDTITNATYTVVPNEDYWGGEPTRKGPLPRARQEPERPGPPRHRQDRLDHDVHRGPGHGHRRARSRCSTPRRTRPRSCRARTRRSAARARRRTSPSARRSTCSSTAARSTRRRSRATRPSRRRRSRSRS